MSDWPEWISPDGSIRLINADCMEVLPTLSGVDAVVTDPPYGISYNREEEPQGKHAYSNRRQVAIVHDDDKPFDPSPWLSFPRCVLWGATCFYDRLPRQRAWLAWDKVTQNGLQLRIAEWEAAYAHPLKRSQMFRWLWSGAYRVEERRDFLHPTQKPIELMRWCIEVVKTPAHGLVLDPFAGSCTTAVACIRTGRRCIAIEKEPKYWEIGIERCKREYDRTALFNDRELLEAVR